MSSTSLDQIVNLAKRRGFVFPSSEIYGGLASTWDYGPYGVLLKNNVKAAWWKAMVLMRDDIVGLDAAILMHPRTWEASGHTDSFSDPLVECRQCHNRFRLDELQDLQKSDKDKLQCPVCGTKDNFTEPKNFNLLMKTFLGTTEDAKSAVYLRGETCQGIYVNFKNVLATSRQKIPFGIAQIGKAFRNEITPGNFTFRMREFEQMEMQFFVKPDAAAVYYDEWKSRRLDWYKSLGFEMTRVRFKDHDKLAHYAKAAVDIEYDTPWGWKEVEGIHNRGDWDLSRHSEFSGKDLSYFDEESGDKFMPYIVETSGGADRISLMALIDAYNEEETDGETRVVLKLHKDLAPIKVAVMPLLKNKPELVEVATKLFHELKAAGIMAEYDESGSIGRRYRRQDEIGTPICVTIDFDTLENKTVTIRDRDTMKQERVGLDKVLKLT
ncbi:MAG: glycine--tRNA ligase [Patescibacteria group bacterium]|jgi:glycyl-tRNA synthetase